MAHVKKQTITLGMGGMMLMRDLTGYRSFASQLESEAVNIKFSILRDVANIFIVPEENLQTLIEDSHLAMMDKQELLSLIHLRNDNQTSKKRGKSNQS